MLFLLQRSKKTKTWCSRAVIDFNQRIEEKLHKTFSSKTRVSIRDVEVIFGQVVISLDSSSFKR